MRKNRPLVLRSNISGSWTRGGGEYKAGSGVPFIRSWGGLILSSTAWMNMGLRCGPSGPVTLRAAHQALTRVIACTLHDVESSRKCMAFVMPHLLTSKALVARLTWYRVFGSGVLPIGTGINTLRFMSPVSGFTANGAHTGTLIRLFLERIASHHSVGEGEG